MAPGRKSGCRLGNGHGEMLMNDEPTPPALLPDQGPSPSQTLLLPRLGDGIGGPGSRRPSQSTVPVNFHVISEYEFNGTERCQRLLHPRVIILPAVVLHWGEVEKHVSRILVVKLGRLGGIEFFPGSKLLPHQGLEIACANVRRFFLCPSEDDPT